VKMKNCKRCNKEFKPIRKSHVFCSVSCAKKTAHLNINKDYFKEITTKEQAYWLGFLFADGNVHFSKNGKWQFQLALAVKDEALIDSFLKAVNGDPQRKIRAVVNGFERVAIIIRDEIFCKNLISQGCVQRKSLIVRFPVLRDDLCDTFLLGYFDGNGTSCSNSASLTCGSLLFLKDIKEKYLVNSEIYKVPKCNCFRLNLRRCLLYKIQNGYLNSLARKRIVYKPKSSKYKGVSLNKKTNKWTAYKKVAGKLNHLGSFNSEDEARDATINYIKSLAQN